MKQSFTEEYTKQLNNGKYLKYLRNIFSRTIFAGNEKECWLFTGSVDKETGYGSIRIFSYKLVKVHRFIAYCFHGLDLFDLTVQACHSCDVRNCVNPFHIWTGTKSDNFLDSSLKGRWHSGNKSEGTFVNNLKSKDWT